MPQFLLSCRPFCLVCCRIARSKEGLVLSSCDPVDSSLSLSLQRSSLVIEIASNHYPLSTQHPLTRSPAFVRSLLPAQRVHRLRFPFFIECFGPFHTLSLPRASAALAHDSDKEIKTLLTPQRCPVCRYSHCFPGHQQRRIDDELACKARDRTVGWFSYPPRWQNPLF